jgi:hypothetical protein
MDIRDMMLYDMVVEDHRARLAHSRTAWQLDALRDGAPGRGALAGIGAWVRARFARVGAHEAGTMEVATSER